jgi:hypothetical protein
MDSVLVGQQRQCGSATDKRLAPTFTIGVSVSVISALGVGNGGAAVRHPLVLPIFQTRVSI